MHSEKILRAAVHPPSSKYKIIRIFFHLWLDIISLKHQCRPFIITTLSLSSSYYLTSDFFLLFSKSSCTFPYFSGSNIDHSCLLLGISEGMLFIHDLKEQTSFVLPFILSVSIFIFLSAWVKTHLCTHTFYISFYVLGFLLPCLVI